MKKSERSAAPRHVDLVKLNDWSQRRGLSYAIRADRSSLKPGKKLSQSHFWKDGKRTRQLVGGTSAIELSYYLRHPSCMAQYGDDQLYIVLGEQSHIEANDPGEVVLYDAHVVCALSELK
jgi:hypothetical protein